MAQVNAVRIEQNTQMRELLSMFGKIFIVVHSVVNIIRKRKVNASILTRYLLIHFNLYGIVGGSIFLQK